MIGVAERLRERGLHVNEFTFSAQSVGRLALTLHGLIKDRALAIPNDPDLIEELSNIRLRETGPGQYRLDHDPDRHDDRGVALGLAAVWLLQLPAPVPTEILEFEDLWSDADELAYQLDDPLGDPFAVRGWRDHEISPY